MWLEELELVLDPSGTPRTEALASPSPAYLQNWLLPKASRVGSWRGVGVVTWWGSWVDGDMGRNEGERGGKNVGGWLDGECGWEYMGRVGGREGCGRPWGGRAPGRALCGLVQNRTRSQRQAAGLRAWGLWQRGKPQLRANPPGQEPLHLEER